MLTVLYGNQVYDEYANWTNLYEHITPSMDIYHGAYVHNNAPNRFQVEWSRCDGTPVLIEDVPAMCRAWVLLG